MTFITAELMSSPAFRATRYHSLVVRRDDMPETLKVTAETGDGLVMGLAHRDLPVWGVQFHPESIASAHGHDMLANVMRMAGVNLPPRPKTVARAA
jgi:anthranilate synthase component II